MSGLHGIDIRLASAERRLNDVLDEVQNRIDGKSADRQSDIESSIYENFASMVQEIVAPPDGISIKDKTGVTRHTTLEKELSALEKEVGTALIRSTARTRPCTRMCENMLHAWGLAVVTLICWVSGTKLTLHSNLALLSDSVSRTAGE